MPGFSHFCSLSLSLSVILVLYALRDKLSLVCHDISLLTAIT